MPQNCICQGLFIIAILNYSTWITCVYKAVAIFYHSEIYDLCTKSFLVIFFEMKATKDSMFGEFYDIINCKFPIQSLMIDYQSYWKTKQRFHDVNLFWSKDLHFLMHNLCQFFVEKLCSNNRRSRRMFVRKFLLKFFLYNKTTLSFLTPVVCVISYFKICHSTDFFSLDKIHSGLQDYNERLLIFA